MRADLAPPEGRRSPLLGLIVLAALAWLVPALRGLPSRPAPVAGEAIYARPAADGTIRLTWSPSEHLPVGADGHLLAADGTPSAPVPGWQGLLLGNPLELNRADLEDLEALPGVGPETAAAVLAARSRLGGFRRVEDLLAVRGVGPATLARLTPWVRVGPR